MMFRKQKEHWDELLPHEKRFEVAMWVFLGAGVVFLVLDVLRVIGVLAIGFNPFPIARAMIVAANVCQAVVCWRTNRNLAHTSIIVAVGFGLGTIWDIVKLFL